MAPLLIGTSIAAALGTGIGGISTSAHSYYKLSQELTEDMEQVVESCVPAQRQINSLASVALQNRQALDLLTQTVVGQATSTRAPPRTPRERRATTKAQDCPLLSLQQALTVRAASASQHVPEKQSPVSVSSRLLI